MKLLTREQMEKLTTPRLLSYRTRLLRVPNQKHHDDMMYKYRISKEHPEWKETYVLCKAVLAKREHVSRAS
jgi:hypothetical protein